MCSRAVVKRSGESGRPRGSRSRRDGKEKGKWRDPNRRLHASGPAFVKCDSHGGAVDNSRAEGWSMLTSRRGSLCTLQAPRSRRLLPRPAMLGQGIGTTLLGPTGAPSFPIDLSSSPPLGGAKPGVLGASRLERIHRTHMGPSLPGSSCWRGRWHTGSSGALTLAASRRVADGVDGSGTVLFGSSDIARGVVASQFAARDRTMPHADSPMSGLARCEGDPMRHPAPATILVQPELGIKVGPMNPTRSKMRRGMGRVGEPPCGAGEWGTRQSAQGQMTLPQGSILFICSSDGKGDGEDARDGYRGSVGAAVCWMWRRPRSRLAIFRVSRRSTEQICMGASAIVGKPLWRLGTGRVLG